MTIQTDLQNAVTLIQKDSHLLHTIVHGSEETDVSTDGGTVKTVSKVLKEMEHTFQESLNTFGMAGESLTEAVAEVKKCRDEAQTQKQEAQALVNALHLPTDLKGQAGKLLGVSQDETGYEAVSSKAVFYGLRKEGAKLIAETGGGTLDTSVFDASVFPVWFITLPGVTMTLNSDGHLLINI